jgi:polyisoprenoid-binding protein YceI
MNTLSVSPARPGVPRRLLLIGASLALIGLGVLGAGTVYVFSSQPAPIAVSDQSGTAQFNFRVTGIPVPGVVPGVQVQASWNPTDLRRAAATVKVDLEKLNTGIALRDTHAKAFLGVTKHPVATFTLDSVQGASSLRAGQQREGVAEGHFTLNGVSQPLKAPITLALDAAGQKLNVTAHFNVAFADYRISIPGADPQTDVTVKFRLSARQ